MIFQMQKIIEQLDSVMVINMTLPKSIFFYKSVSQVHLPLILMESVHYSKKVKIIKKDLDLDKVDK